MTLEDEIKAIRRDLETLAKAVVQIAEKVAERQTAGTLAPAIRSAKEVAGSS